MIIGVAAKARSGKDTFAKFLQEYFFINYRVEFIFGAFANELKRMCRDQFGLSTEQLWGDEKELIDLRYQRRGEGSNVPAFWTPREIMQAFGEFFRSIDYDFWVKQLHKNLLLGSDKNVIITDVRHINECEYVKRNGTLIKIIRGEQQKIHGMDHVSEVVLDDKPDDYFDIIVDNDGTLDDLRLAAQNVADAIMKLQNLKSEGRIHNG
jgi:hypothetical protein